MATTRRHLSTVGSILNRYLLPAGITLLFLVLWIKSQAIDAAQHQRYTSALRQIQELDARMDRQLLQVRLGKLSYYDPIVDRLAQLRQLQVELQSVPAFIDRREQKNIVAAIESYIRVYRDKEEKIDRFKSQQAILRNSLSYFPIAVAELTQQSMLDHNLVDRLNLFLQKIFNSF
jgi:hypothetical protein